MDSKADFEKAGPPQQLEDSERTVIVWDHDDSRLKTTVGIISDCGPKHFFINTPAEANALRYTPLCCFAVIALGTSPAKTSFALEIVRNLHSCGMTVISHEYDSNRWSLGMRCRALLAGASFVLDSRSPEFAQELQRLLMDLIVQRSLEFNQKRTVKDIMIKFGVVGESEAMLSIFRQVLRVSPLCRLPVLITGETGTGKELIARAIHQLDPKRCSGPFVPVNCGAIAHSLAESELFGHRKGAFTGADRDRKGLLRSAHGGVLFLDEIGELGGTLQVKLLRVLQEERVLGVGDDREVRVDLRVISATNRNLSEMLEAGEFREDLFYRLNVFSIHIPPLRERTVDLDSLVQYFLIKHRVTEASEIPAVDRDFVEALTQLDFPGNVRQLENLVWCALANKKDGATPLGLKDLTPDIWEQICLKEGRFAMRENEASKDTGEPAFVSCSLPAETLLPGIAELLESNQWNLMRSLNYCERLLLEAALHRTKGNQSKAARLLGITPRSVYNKLRKLDIEDPMTKPGYHLYGK